MGSREQKLYPKKKSDANKKCRHIYFFSFSSSSSSSSLVDNYIDIHDKQLEKKVHFSG